MRNNEHGVTHLLLSLKYSLAGLVTCFRDEVAFRQECMLAIPHFLGILMCPISTMMRLYMTALWFLVCAIELLNTAIEAVVNQVSPEWHILAKKAKDCASAAVFCVLLLLGISWGVVVFKLIAK